ARVECPETRPCPQPTPGARITPPIANLAACCYEVSTSNVAKVPGGIRHADRPSSQQLPLPARAVVAGGTRRGLRDRPLSASAGHARAGGVARHPSARKIASHYRQWQHHRRI